jgi:hypothetical protein
MAVTLLLLLIPAADIGIAVVQRALMGDPSAPAALLDFSDCIGRRRTMVVVPTLLTSTDTVAALLNIPRSSPSNMERHPRDLGISLTRNAGSPGTVAFRGVSQRHRALTGDLTGYIDRLCSHCNGAECL